MVFLFSCSTKKDEGVAVSDASLFNIAQTVSSFSYYKNRLDTLLSDPSSPHGGYMRVRFNQKAMSVMNDSASRIIAPTFPDGSMVVKEVYDFPGGPLLELAIMYKVDGASNSSGGWIWNEMLPDGTIEYSAANNGAQCIDCHRNSNNLDLIRTFYTH
jgi:hypothetical protein